MNSVLLPLINILCTLLSFLVIGIGLMISLLFLLSVIQKYKSWRTRHLRLLSDGSLQSVIVSKKKVEETHSLAIVTLRKIGISAESALVLEGRVGIKAFCKKDGRDTYFRCIIKPRDLEGLCGALARVSKNHNIQEFLKSRIYIPKDCADGLAGTEYTYI